MAELLAFKDATVMLEIIEYPVHPKLCALLLWISQLYDRIIFTSGKRDGDTVHNTVPLRGIDIRSRVYHDPKKICEHINKMWVYDPKRPLKKCAKYHDTGSGFHFHLQVHPNTFKQGD